MHRPAVGAHPFGGQAVRFTRPDVPRFCVIDGRPWSPWFRGFINAKAAVEPRVATLVRHDLAKHITLEPRVVADTCPIATAGIAEHVAALTDCLRPDGRIRAVQPLKVLVSRLVGEPLLRYAGKDSAISR